MPSRYFQAGFMRVVAFVERQPVLVRAFEALFARVPLLERLIARQVGAARAPEGLRDADGCLWYLPADAAREAEWRALLKAREPA